MLYHVIVTTIVTNNFPCFVVEIRIFGSNMISVSLPQHTIEKDDAIFGQAIQRKESKKKISLMDEAGGELCHVKLFENGKASFEPQI